MKRFLACPQRQKCMCKKVYFAKERKWGNLGDIFDKKEQKSSKKRETIQKRVVKNEGTKRGKCKITSICNRDGRSPQNKFMHPT